MKTRYENAPKSRDALSWHFQVTSMRTPKYYFPLLFMCSFLAMAQPEVCVSPAASEIWEKALSAKGGTERLQAISNFLVVERLPRGDKAAIYAELYIFPDKYWSWDNSGGVFGTRLMVNNGTGEWTAFDSGQNGGRGVTWSPLDEWAYRDMQKAQALFLMETRSYRPKILDLKTERLGRVEYDVITVDAGLDRVKYYIDRKTSLVRRVSPVERYGNVVTIAAELVDYRPVQGIMVPSRIKYREGGTYDLKFAFDVEYDPEIFKRKPAIEDGPEGWKPAKK